MGSGEPGSERDRDLQGGAVEDYTRNKNRGFPGLCDDMHTDCCRPTFSDHHPPRKTLAKRERTIHTFLVDGIRSTINVESTSA